MEEVPPELHAKAKEAEELCPTGAIALVGDDGEPLRGGRANAVGFHEQLARSWTVGRSLLCTGLDPDPASFPRPLDRGHEAVFRFCKEIVDATADLVYTFEPQIAYFVSQREEPALEACAPKSATRTPTRR